MRQEPEPYHGRRLPRVRADEKQFVHGRVMEEALQTHSMPVVNTLTLLNPLRPEMNPVVVVARVTIRAMHLVIPESVRRQLHLDTMSTRAIVLPDGKECLVPYVGPIEIRANGLTSVSGAIVMGDEVVLGAIPLGDVTAG